MTYTLRPYQQEACDAAFNFLTTKDGNGLIIMPTGTGKSLVLAEICRRAIEIYADTNIIAAVDSKELVKQNYDKLRSIWPQGLVGLYSAGLGKKQKNRQVTFAGIQSVYKKAFAFHRIDILIADESHMISKKSEGIWHKFIDELKVSNPHLRLIGLTASPFRTTHGMIYGKDCLFTEVIYEYGLIRAIDEGWLAPLHNHRTETHYDVTGVKKRNGDFIESELQKVVNVDSLTQKCVQEIVSQGVDRKSWLAFCTGIDHSMAVRDAIRAHGVSCETVTGETPKAERDSILARYRAGEIRCVTNANVLVKGFDHPPLDMIAFMRPTSSAIIWLQGLGRGMRTFDGKNDCKILDFADNTSRFPTLDKIRVKEKISSGEGEAPKKMCPECMEVCPAAALECSNCGFIFRSEIEIKIGSKAVGGALLSNQLDIRTLTVRTVHYARHQKEGKPDTLRATYLVNEEIKTFPEWVSPESQHRGRFESWWRKRSKQLPPADVTGCLEFQKTLAQPTTITVRKNGKYFEIIGASFEALRETA